MSASNARTRVTKHPDVRREEILAKALELFTRDGFDRTSVQAITDEVGVAKGLFYHYFHSKQDVLNAAVEWQADVFFASLPAHASDMEGDARAKIRAIIRRIVNWKFDEHRDLVVTYLRVMYRDENLVLRTKLTQEYMYRMAPLFSEIIEEGVRDGVCSVQDPQIAAEMVFSMWVGGGEQLGQTMLTLTKDPSVLEALLARIRGWETGVERLLGIEDGTLGLYDYDYLEAVLGELASIPDPDASPATRKDTSDEGATSARKGEAR